jgi:hypothetical protein
MEKYASNFDFVMWAGRTYLVDYKKDGSDTGLYGVHFRNNFLYRKTSLMARGTRDEMEALANG